MSSASVASNQVPISRRELRWLIAAYLVGAVLRLWFPERMGIEHFDEGVYASNFWFGAEQGYSYPARHLYAPPLLPVAIEWTMVLASLCGIRPTGFVPMIPSLIAGLLTIPSLWWVGRRWFGPRAGLVAAWLVATSDFHASYSRAAMTDVPVCLFILWGIYFLKQAMESGGWRDILSASLFTSLAWWTKYNGWLPLAVGLSGGLAWQMCLPAGERKFGPVLKRWSIVAGLSFLFWSPVLIGLQKHGGYQAVAANHRQYINGLDKWLSNVVHQGLNVGVYDNVIGLPVELWAKSVQHRMNRKLWSGSIVAPFTVVEAARFDRPYHPITPVEERVVSAWIVRSLLLTTPGLLLVTALFGLVSEILARRQCRQTASIWFLTAWLAGLCVATPFYSPYPRLILPLLVSLWLGAGLAIQRIIDTWGSRTRSGWARFVGSLRLQFSGPILMICIIAIRFQTGSFHAWQDRSQFQTEIHELAGKIKERTAKAGYAPDEAVVFVAGHPPTFFGLKGAELSLVAPIQDKELAERQNRPTFVAYVHTTRIVPGRDADLLIGSTSNFPSHFVLLDEPDCFEQMKFNAVWVEMLP
ncbi:MAG: glycosyltransferase family 39 protein [Planctomycetaceae bacterium]